VTEIRGGARDGCFGGARVRHTKQGSHSKTCCYIGSAPSPTSFNPQFCHNAPPLHPANRYTMDYNQLLNYHRARGADVTIATTPADEDHATHLGVLTVRGGG